MTDTLAPIWVGSNPEIRIPPSIIIPQNIPTDQTFTLTFIDVAASGSGETATGIWPDNTIFSLGPSTGSIDTVFFAGFYASGWSGSVSQSVNLLTCSFTFKKDTPLEASTYYQLSLDQISDLSENLLTTSSYFYTFQGDTSAPYVYAIQGNLAVCDYQLYINPTLGTPYLSGGVAVPSNITNLVSRNIFEIDYYLTDTFFDENLNLIYGAGIDPEKFHVEALAPTGSVFEYVILSGSIQSGSSFGQFSDYTKAFAPGSTSSYSDITVALRNNVAGWPTGSYQVKIRMTDLSGNVMTPFTQTFTVSDYNTCTDNLFFPNKILEIPKSETLLMHWTFENVTGSNSTSNFLVEDTSSGSIDLLNRNSWFSNLRYHQYPGKGDFFPANDINVTQKEFVASAKQLLPDVQNSSDLIDISTQDEPIFTRDTKPINYFYALEKSPYAILSEEMMKLFSTSKAFDNLIGEPVNHYRQKYKDLEKLRSLYFERIRNSTIDFEKFVDYFKWFDSSISSFIEQLIPASANFSPEIRTLVESHILEKNKYWNKLPNFKYKLPLLQGITSAGSGSFKKMESLSGSLIPVKFHNKKTLNDYEIIQGGGRISNKRYLNKTNGTASVTLNSPINGYPVWTLLEKTQSKNKFIFSEKFSAPGEIKTLSRGYLDPIAEEYSVYNNLNFRNLTIRISQSVADQTHATQFGANSGANKVNRNTRKRLSLSSSVFVTASNYDNKFVSRAIPQSDLQYSWVSASVDKTKNQPLGYISNFRIPIGLTGSLDSESISYISGSSNFGIRGTAADLIGLNSIIVESMDSDNNILSSSAYNNTTFETINNNTNILNALLLHRNGGFNFKIKTTDHPIVRRQKIKNILSVIDPPQSITLNVNGRALPYVQSINSFKNYIEPGVSFKNKPLIQTIDFSDSKNVDISYSYSNNINKFANQEINKNLGIKKCDDEQFYSKVKKLYLDSTEVDNNPIHAVKNIKYSETIYPKDKNTGLATTRTRINYTETASVQNATVYNFYDANQSQIQYPVASGSYGENGIDRNPLERRTFWRNDAKNRNRWALIDFSTSTTGSTTLRNDASPQTTLINSQGIKDGKATSIWPLGSEIYHTQSAEGIDDSNSAIMGIWGNYDFGELAPMRGMLGLSYNSFGAGGNAEFATDSDLSYWQNSSMAQYGTSSVGRGNYFYQHPTASVLYSKMVYPDHLIFGANGKSFVPVNGQLYTEYQDDFNHRFRTPFFAGKGPWFDSYDEYASDIKSMSKEYSIIPEFNISKNMDYYIKQNDGNFRNRNSKIFSIEGGQLTQSALTENSDFNGDFFAKFIHSDSSENLDSIIADHDKDFKVNKITLKCKGIKKLLPYNGFYPITRTLQLATLFSQSYGAHIGGTIWKDGKTLDSANPPSGNLAMAAFLQPFFAPGILYNTIKSGIAMDFPVFTGSAAGAHGPGSSCVRIENQPNFKIQFESLIDLNNGAGDGGVPLSASDSSKNIFWQGPEYLFNSASSTPNGPRNVFFNWNGNEESPLYRLAMHNFLAESINFFLKDGNLKSITSKPANKMKALTNAKTYYMDIKLSRSKNLLMYGGRYNNVNKLYHTATVNGPENSTLVPEYAALSYTGKFFGHPFRWADESNYGVSSPGAGPGLAAWGTAPTDLGILRQSHIKPIIYDDAAYAPYLPPYYFGDSIVRISYVADGTEKNQADPISYVLSKATTLHYNDSLNNKFLFYNKDNAATSSIKPAWQARSTVTSSINIFGVKKGFKVAYDPKNINKFDAAKPLSVEDNDASYNSWVISPKFECPIMNFNNQPDEKYTITFEDGESLGTPSATPTAGNKSFIPKGMWSGYGEFCSGQDGVFLSVQESFPDLQPAEKVTKGSLVDIFGFSTTPVKLGEIEDTREISEAVVAIPFVDNQINDENLANTVSIMGKNFFSISSGMFNLQKARKETNETIIKENEFGNKFEIKETSISKMIEQMKNYIIPPEMNFIKYNDISPFAMYIFEFKHNLDKQDVADIWQGVMPKIAMKAEKDEIEVSHAMELWEFFEGKKLPKQIRWMIFKVKKKAANNYFEKTSDSKDDSRFKFDFKNGTKTPDYSFNWPGDYFSLVELAKIETQFDIGKIK